MTSAMWLFVCWLSVGGGWVIGRNLGYKHGYWAGHHDGLALANRLASLEAGQKERSR